MQVRKTDTPFTHDKCLIFSLLKKYTVVESKAKISTHVCLTSARGIKNIIFEATFFEISTETKTPTRELNLEQNS